jgi:S-DNA-T family DNA segregation ATPase FtsK/SpoIIIE
MNTRASRSLELVKALEDTVADFAKREELVTRDTRSRRFAAERKFNEAVERIDHTLDTASAQVTARFEQVEEGLQNTHRARQGRIQKFHNSGVRDLPRLAQEARERWLGGLQMKKFRADRTYAADVQKTEAHFTQLAGRAEAQRAELLETDRKAKRAFSGYSGLISMLRRERRTEPVSAASSADLEALMVECSEKMRNVEEKLLAFSAQPLPRFFRTLPLGFLIVSALVLGGVVAFAMGFSTVAMIAGLAIAAIVLLIIFGVHQSGLSKAKPAARAIASDLADAIQLDESISAGVAAGRELELGLLKAGLEKTQADIAAQWDRADTVEANFKKAVQGKLKTQVPRATALNERTLKTKLGRVAAERDTEISFLTEEAEGKRAKFSATRDAEISALDAEEATKWTALVSEWKEKVIPLYEEINALNDAINPGFPDWTPGEVNGWTPPRVFSPVARFGRLELNLARDPERIPTDPRLALPGSAQVSLPLALSFPEEGSLLFETRDSGGAAVIGTLNNVILRLLSKTPPGKVAFTIIDPVGLGQSFAGLMHVADHEDSIINRRIWTQRDQIEERLAELNEHIEKVIQMYLRNEYATITEYNEQAGSVAEKYHFLVIADFPSGFSETSAKRLQSIAISGPRCGVFTLIHRDQRQPLPDGFVADELRQNSVLVRHENGVLSVGPETFKTSAKLVLDAPPSDELAVDLVHRIGKASIDSNRVEVPFVQVAPKPDEYWQAETTNELRIAVGRTGATKLQYLAIGKGTRQHALFAGKTGSGKSTLFHVIITNLALTCSPEQVEFYLIDFKKGVEFKCYATKKLPHAKVIAIESDREFGLSVLQRVDDELKRRGDMFRKLGVQDVAGYKRVGGTEPMPRSLLLIDEFQEFFVDDDAIAQAASLLFDRIVRQGRAFGIHVLLGSQTLGGAYTLARATLGQMVIRVALQCNEADAYLIMDENNPAPRLLSRPGEGIYNDAAGAIEGNSPFQVVWMSDEERDEWLDKVHDLAVERGGQYSSPIVFEGNAPSDVTENEFLTRALAQVPSAPPQAAHCWLGAPNSIKGPTEAVFRRQSGNHLLIVGQREEASLTLIGTSLLSLAAQYPVGSAKFVLLHACNPGSSEESFIEKVVSVIPHGVRVSRGHDLPEIMNELATDLKERIGSTGEGESAPIFFFIHGVQKFKKLRHEDDFSFGDSDSAASPGQQFNDLICEGSTQALHLILAIDTFNNVGRFMSRKALSEIEMRVLFQMSQNDSASLIESPKASALGLHRALFYNEHEGYLETFRPYAMPDSGWIDAVGEQLKNRG